MRVDAPAMLRPCTLQLVQSVPPLLCCTLIILLLDTCPQGIPRSLIARNMNSEVTGMDPMREVGF